MSIKQYVKQLTGGAIVDLRFTFQTLLQGKNNKFDLPKYSNMILT